MTKSRLLLAAVLILATFAFSQATIGNIIRLGQSTSANLPASSTTIKGGLIFDLDAGAPKYNDGTAWQSFSSSGGSTWYDAGVESSGGVFPGGGTGASQQTDAFVIRNVLNSLWIKGSTGGGVAASQARPAITIFSNTTGLESPGIDFRSGFQYADRLGYIFGSNFTNADADFGLNMYSGTVSFGSPSIGKFGRFDSSLKGFLSATPSGFDAWANATTGARIHVGTGSNDYLISDSIGIQSPSYIQSTRSFATGPGFYANSAQLSGSVTDNFTAAVAATGGIGTLSFDSSFLRMVYQPTSISFAPLAPQFTYGSQTFSTRIPGLSGNTTLVPQFAEYVMVDNVSTLNVGLIVSGATTHTVSTVAAAGRTLLAISTGTEGSSYYLWESERSAAPGALQPFVAQRQNPKFCSWFATGASRVATRVWVGLASAAPTPAAGATMNGDGAMFRMDDTVNTTLDFCVRSSGTATQSCTSTGVSPGNNKTYHLCAQASSAGVYSVWVDGVFVTKTSGNEPVSTSQLGAAQYIQSTTGGTARTCSFGVMQVESL